MHQVKVFKSIESELWTTEKEINQWLQETKAKVVSITGNIAPQTGGHHLQGFSASDVLILILYEVE
jgi:hypothetical protein